MASSQSGKAARRPVAAAAKSRPPGRAMKGLTKVSRVPPAAGTSKVKTKAAAAASKSGTVTKAPRAKTARAADKAVAAPKAGAAAKTRAPGKAVAKPRAVKSAAIDLAAREKDIAREANADAVNRSLDLLEALARTGPVPLAVLAERTGKGKTATSDLLAILRARDFVVQDETDGLWRIGARWAVLGNAATEQGALAATAMPCLAGLGNATGENVYLRVRDGLECETVAIYQTDPLLRVYTEVGAKMPLHAGSGRLLLAHAPEAVQTQVLARRLQRYTPSTRIDPTWIAADLHRIRQRGFLITDSEVVAGTVSVCAPVRDASGQVIATLLIGAPSLRMRPPRPRALMPLVVEAARKLSTALGWAADSPVPEPANGPLDPGRPSAATGTVAAAAIGAAIARPHSVFR